MEDKPTGGCSASPNLDKHLQKPTQNKLKQEVNINQTHKKQLSIMQLYNYYHFIKQPHPPDLKPLI